MGGDSPEQKSNIPEGFVRRPKRYGRKPPAGDYAELSEVAVEFRPNRLDNNEEGDAEAELLSLGGCLSKWLYSRGKGPEAMDGIWSASLRSPDL